MDKLITNLNQSWTLLSEKIFAWLDSIVLSLPNLVLVILAVLLGKRIIKMANQLTAKIAERQTPNIGVRNLIKNVTSVILHLGLIVVLLTILGLEGTVTTVLASAGVAGLALGLALQDPLMNLFSGIIMSVKHVFEVGDFIETNGFTGKVQDISLKSTVVRMLTGEEVNIPNKLVLQAPVKNFTTSGLRRIDLTCGISYGDDLERVKEIATQAIRPLATDQVIRPVEFIYTNFGDSSINFQLRFWSNPADAWEFLDTKSNAIIALKKAFDQNEISIPFPIRTLDFGIKGGLSLKESLAKN